MITVVFALRGPENAELGRVDMPVVPRIGEWVSFSRDAAAYTVHSVDYFIADGVAEAFVVLKR